MTGKEGQWLWKRKGDRNEKRKGEIEKENRV